MVLTVATACSGTAAGPAGRTTEPPATEATTSSTSTTLAPPADVQELIAGTTMTERAKRLFLAATPAIEDAASFVRNCGLEPRSDTGAGSRTHTQGCFVAGRIHLLAPDRPEGHDLLYVVAAHELLHAVYAELRPAERATIDAELTAARAGNDRLEERLQAYGSTPTLLNEMHAILGSEFEGLSATLEAHYAQFFSNRAAVVAVRQRILGSREDEIRRLRADADALDARIEALKADQEQRRIAGDVRGYNANLPVVNGLIDRYNTQVDRLNALIDEYNDLLGS